MKKIALISIVTFLIIGCGDNQTKSELSLTALNMRADVPNAGKVECWERPDKSLAIMTIYIDGDAKYNQKIAYSIVKENGAIKEIRFRNEHNDHETWIVNNATVPEIGMTKVYYGLGKKVICESMASSKAENLLNNHLNR